MKKLKLEINDITDQTGAVVCNSNLVLMTPPIGEDYWLYRVKLVKDQSIIGFPKFGCLGVGFAIEEDWNTNLPIDNYDDEKGFETIWNHIKHNKKYPAITKKMGMDAIRLIRQAYDRFGNVSTVSDKIKNGAIDIPEAGSPFELFSMIQKDIIKKVPKGD